MARVKAFQVPGVIMTFPSADHEPPHFHARRPGDWRIRVYIQDQAEDMIEVIRPPDAVVRGSDRRALVHGVRTHRAELLDEWKACHGSE